MLWKWGQNYPTRFVPEFTKIGEEYIRQRGVIGVTANFNNRCFYLRTARFQAPDPEIERNAARGDTSLGGVLPSSINMKEEPMTNSSARQVMRFGRGADEETEELIRRRAFELYEARGRGDGHDVEDWLQAEAEIAGRSEAAAA